MAGERSNGKDGREQYRCRQDHEHRIRQPVQIAQRNSAAAEPLADVFVEIVGQVDDVDEDRKAERRRHEDLPELDKHVAVEGAHHTHQAASLSRARRSRQPNLERMSPLIAPIISFRSPPRAVLLSLPILLSNQSASSPKITLAIHIETTAGINPRLAIDSPAIRQM